MEESAHRAKGSSDAVALDPVARLDSDVIGSVL
ncbi:hypothetical protein EV148_102392 [Dokdonella fugitiva]|jgi:hypothetical protein|uniref:Uncharacterized protein n=1 Tax=Dokdonella fugitiva TaxID=328517 RepID=A0A4R2IBY2_9GAMM|nr:hypothetical protein EV148_102392 [Dokdonella fugitiva]